VGRDDELRRLSAALDDAESHGAALIGAPGVGKTRLARQVGELAALRGLTTVSVRASRSAASVPLGALAPLLAFLGLESEELANPVLAVVQALARRGDEGRLVLVVDDAHDLDPASAAVLDQVVAAGAAFVVCTVRAGAPSVDTALELWQDDRVERIRVEPLSDEAVRALVGSVLGGSVDGAAVQAILRACRGNLLSLREVLQGALESGRLTSSHGLWRLNGSLLDTPRLRDLIEHRLDGLAPDEREALELVALGEPAELRFLGGLVHLGVLERLERLSLLDTAEGPHGPEVRLGHPLYGEAVRAHLSAVRRARLCTALADAREAVGDLTAADLLRVAVWRLEAGTTSPELMLAAGRVAFRSEDFELALRLARAVWASAPCVEAAMLLADAGPAVTGHTDEISAALRHALALATDDEQRVAVAARLASGLFIWGESGEAAEEVLASVEKDLSSDEFRRHLAGHRATLLLLEGRVAESYALGAATLSDASDVASVQSLRDVGVALAFLGRTHDALAHTEEALRARRSLDERELAGAEAVFLVARALALAEEGRLERAAELAEAGYAASVERAHPDGQAWFSAILGMTLLTEGRLDSAAHLFAETAAAFGELGHPARRWGLGGVALATGQSGDGEAAAAAVRELDAEPPTAFHLMDAHLERGRAWAAVAGGDLATARALLRSAAARAMALGERTSAAAAFHDLVRIGRSREGLAGLEQLADEVDGDLTAARLDHARAAVSGDPDLAHAAADRFEGCAAYLFAAEAAVLEQRTSRERGLRRRATAAELRARELRGRCESPDTPGLRLPDAPGASPLSAREREVALLAAEGLTSREVAERLFLSVRTVENHLHRAYTKLGVTDRRELRSRLRSPATGSR